MKPETKKCSKCQQVLLLSEFIKRRKSPTKPAHYQSWCRPCHAAYRRWYRHEAGDLALYLYESKAKKVKTNHVYCHRKLIPFTIKVNDIRDLLKSQTVNNQLICAVTNVPLNTMRNHPLSPSIDRINCDLGYINGNIRIVSLLYNIARRTWDDDVVLSVFRTIAELHIA